MKKYLLILIIVLPLIGNAQPVQFTKDSIPMVDGEIVFYVDFEADLSKTEFHQRTHAYLDEVLDPYSGDFIADNNDHTACRIIDYIDIGGGAFQSLGMYMTYHLQLTYADGSCTMIIRDITYMEKRYFEAQEASSRKLNMPKYTGEEVMLDKKYRVLTKKKASEEVTMASLDRINKIISGLSASFVKDSLAYTGSTSHGKTSPNQSLKKLPVYTKEKDADVYAVTVLHCSFNGEKLKYLEQGGILRYPAGIGFPEPSSNRCPLVRLMCSLA